MYKSSIAICALILCCSAALSAQKGISYYGELRPGLATLSHTSFHPVDFTGAAGYSFNRSVTVNAVLDCSIGLFKIDGDKTYEVTGALGLFGGYNFARTENFVLELCGGVGADFIGNPDWDYIYYDGSLKIHETMKKNKTNYVGFGYRYYNTQNHKFPNQSMVYISLGLKFGPRR